VRVVLSFDVEDHTRIEAASGLTIDPALREHYQGRVEPATCWILDQLARLEIQATFFIVGQVARSRPELVRAIQRSGHEVASHSWDHRRVHRFTPESFREDVVRSVDALEQITGVPVFGFRAPTFSVVRETGWALDVLSELGLLYDSSIYPVRHDRYGVPDAPRGPFLACGLERSILELPPATLRLLGANVPVGGGGYFRLLPLALMERAIRQARRQCRPAVVTLYFHPWEFDPGQPKLPLRGLNRLRTYVGLGRSRGRLSDLLTRHAFARAVDIARELAEGHPDLPVFRPAA
jgi:polysaccharide deacetylase family protein (PEP-CTERM system associated)